MNSKNINIIVVVRYGQKEANPWTSGPLAQTLKIQLQITLKTDIIRKTNH